MSGKQVRGFLSTKPGTKGNKIAKMTDQAEDNKMPPDSIEVMYAKFPWLKEYHKTCQAHIGSASMQDLDALVTEFIGLVTPEARSCLLKPFRSTKLKRCFLETIGYFNSLYREVKESIDPIPYLDKMSNLLAMYLDAEIRATVCMRENPRKVTSRVTANLIITLDNSQEHILDAVLKCQSILTNHRSICASILSKLLSDIPRIPRTELLYIRLLLVFKLWKIVAFDPADKKRLNRLAADKLPFPPTLLERRKSLTDVLPLIPKKKRTNATFFLMKSKFSVRDAIRTFFKVLKESQHTFPEVINLCSPSQSSNYLDSQAGRTIRILNAMWSSLNVEALGDITVMKEERRRKSGSASRAITATATSSSIRSTPVPRAMTGESRKRVHSEESNSEHLQKQLKVSLGIETEKGESSPSEVCNNRKPKECNVTSIETKQETLTYYHDFSSDTLPQSSLPVPRMLPNKDLPDPLCIQNGENLSKQQNENPPTSTCNQTEVKPAQSQNKNLPVSICNQSEVKLAQLQNKYLSSSTYMQSEEKFPQLQNKDLAESTCMQSEDKLPQLPNKNLPESICIKIEDKIGQLQNKDLPTPTCMQSEDKLPQLQNKDLPEFICIKKENKLGQLQNKDLPKSTCIIKEDKIGQLQNKDLPTPTFMQSEDKLPQLQNKDLPKSTHIQREEKLPQLQNKDQTKSTCIKKEDKLAQLQNKEQPESTCIQSEEKLVQAVFQQCLLTPNSTSLSLMQSRTAHDPSCTFPTESVCSSTVKTNVPVTENEPKSEEASMLSPVENPVKNYLCSSIMTSHGAVSVSSSTTLKQKEDEKSPNKTDMQSESRQYHDREAKIDFTEYGFVEIPLNLYDCISQDETHLEMSADYFTVGTLYDRLSTSNKPDCNIAYYEFDSQISIDDDDLNQEMFTEDIENVALPLLASLEGKPKKIETTLLDMKGEYKSSHFTTISEKGIAYDTTTDLLTKFDSPVDNNIHKSSSNLSTIISEIDGNVSSPLTDMEPQPGVSDIPQLSTSRIQIELPEEKDFLAQSENDISVLPDSIIPARKRMSKIVFPGYVLCNAIEQNLLYSRSDPNCKENINLLRIIFSGFPKSPSHKFTYFYRKLQQQNSDNDETEVQVESLCENIDASSSCNSEIDSTSQKSKPLPESRTTQKPTLNSEAVPCQSNHKAVDFQTPGSNQIQISETSPKPTISTITSTDPLFNTKIVTLPPSASVLKCSTTNCASLKSLIPSTSPSDQTALKSTVSSPKLHFLPNPQIPITAFPPNPIDIPNSQIPKPPSKPSTFPGPQTSTSTPFGLPALSKPKISMPAYSHSTIVPSPQISNSKYLSQPTTFPDPQDLSSPIPDVSIPMPAHSPISTIVSNTQIPKVVPSLRRNSKYSTLPITAHSKHTLITNSETPTVSSNLIEASNFQLPIDLSIEPTTLSSSRKLLLSNSTTVSNSQTPETASNRTHVRKAQNPKQVFSSEPNLLQKYLIQNINSSSMPSIAPYSEIPLDVSSKFAAVFNPQMPIDATTTHFSNSQFSGSMPSKPTAIPSNQMPMATSLQPIPQDPKSRTSRKPYTGTNQRKPKTLPTKHYATSNHQIPGAISFPTSMASYQVPIAASFKTSRAPHTQIPIAASFKQSLPPYPQVPMPALKKRYVSIPKSANKQFPDSHQTIFHPESSGIYPSILNSGPSQPKKISQTETTLSTNQPYVLPQSVPMSAFPYQPPSVTNMSGGYPVSFGTTSLPPVPVTPHIQTNHEVPRIINRNTHLGLPTDQIPPSVPYYDVNGFALRPLVGDDDLRKKVEETINTLENERVPEGPKLNALPLKKRKQTDENQTELRSNVREPVTALLDSYPSTLMFSIAECVSGLERKRTSTTRTHLNPAQILAEITSRHVLAGPPPGPPVLAASSAPPPPPVAPTMREPTFPYPHSAAPTGSQVSGTYHTNLEPIPRHPFGVQDSPECQVQVALQNRKPEEIVPVGRTEIWRPVDLSAPPSSKANMNNK